MNWRFTGDKKEYAYNGHSTTIYKIEFYNCDEKVIDGGWIESKENLYMAAESNTFIHPDSIVLGRSVIVNSNIGKRCVIIDSPIHNSNVHDSNITNSAIVNSAITPHSIIKDSAILNAGIHNADIFDGSSITNSTICHGTFQGAYVFGSDLYVSAVDNTPTFVNCRICGDNDYVFINNIMGSYISVYKARFDAYNIIIDGEVVTDMENIDKCEVFSKMSQKKKDCIKRFIYMSQKQIIGDE